jgi:hypothetical protein
MEFAAYIFPVAFACIALSIAVERRAEWAWFAGWVLLFFMAGAASLFCYSALYSSTNDVGVLAALTMYAGSFAVWITGAVWLATHRESFRGRKPRKRVEDAAVRRP